VSRWAIVCLFGSGCGATVTRLPPEVFVDPAAVTAIEVEPAEGVVVIESPVAAYVLAEEALERARQSYRDLDFERSLAAAGEVQVVLERDAAVVDDFAALRRALVLRAMNEHALERVDAARAALEYAIAIAPAEDLDEGLAPPPVQELYAAVRTELLARPPGAALVTTTPVGARVLLDGRDIGRAPVTANGVTGRHLLRVEADLMVSRTLVVELEAGRTDAFSVELAPASAREIALALARGAIAPRAIDEATRLAVRSELDVDWIIWGDGGRLAALDLRSGRVDERAVTADLARDVDEVRTRRVERLDVDDSTVFESPWFWTIGGAILLAGGGAALIAALVYEPSRPFTIVPNPP
jgi:hypothetical protein